MKFKNYFFFLIHFFLIHFIKSIGENSWADITNKLITSGLAKKLISSNFNNIQSTIQNREQEQESKYAQNVNEYSYTSGKLELTNTNSINNKNHSLIQKEWSNINNKQEVSIKHRNPNDPLPLTPIQLSYIKQIYFTPPCHRPIRSIIIPEDIKTELNNISSGSSIVDRVIKHMSLDLIDNRRFRHIRRRPIFSKSNHYEPLPIKTPKIELFIDDLKSLNTKEYSFKNIDQFIKKLKEPLIHNNNNNNIHNNNSNINNNIINLKEYFNIKVLKDLVKIELKLENEIIISFPINLSIRKECQFIVFDKNYNKLDSEIENDFKQIDNIDLLKKYWIILINNQIILEKALENYYSRYLYKVSYFFKSAYNFPDHVKNSVRFINSYRNKQLSYYQKEDLDPEFNKSRIIKHYINYVKRIRCYYQKNLLTVLNDED